VSIKNTLKKKGLQLSFKSGHDSQLLISSGREFHNTGAIYENAL